MKKIQKLSVGAVLVAMAGIAGTAQAGDCTGTVNNFYVQTSGTSAYLLVNQQASTGGVCVAYYVGTNNVAPAWAAMIASAKASNATITVSSSSSGVISKIFR